MNEANVRNSHRPVDASRWNPALAALAAQLSKISEQHASLQRLEQEASERAVKADLVAAKRLKDARLIALPAAEHRVLQEALKAATRARFYLRKARRLEERMLRFYQHLVHEVRVLGIEPRAASDAERDLVYLACFSFPADEPVAAKARSSGHRGSSPRKSLSAELARRMLQPPPSP